MTTAEWMDRYLLLRRFSGPGWLVQRQMQARLDMRIPAPRGSR